MGIPPVPSTALLENLAASGGRTAAAPIHPAELQSMQSQNALRAQETSGLVQEQAIKQQALRDNDVIRRAYINTSGDPNEVRDYAIKNGISGSGLMGWQQHAYDLQQKAALLKQTDIANQTNLHEQQVKLHDEAGNIIDSINSIKDPAAQQAAYAQNVGRLQQLAPDVQWTDPTKYTPDQGQFYSGVLGHAKAVLDRSKTQAEIDQAVQATKASAATAAKTAAELPGVQAESTLKQAQAAALGMSPEARKAMVDASIPPDKYPEENARAASAVENAVRLGLGPNAIQGAIKDSSDRIGRLESSVAQAKATQPIKIETAQATQAAAASMATPQALDLMAEQALNGQFSSRNPVLMAKVYGRAADLAQQRGMSNQQVIMERNAAQANKGALDSLTKQYETVKPFAEMAEKNAGILEQKAAKVSNLGASFWNTPLRTLESNFAGNTDVAAFKAALLPVQADFARLLSSPNASGVLSDSARQEMESAIRPGATPGEIKAALDVFRNDAKNRKESYEANIADLRGKTVVGSTAVSTTAPKASALPQGGGKVIDRATAQQFYEAAGKDPAKARKLASDNGWKVQ